MSPEITPNIIPHRIDMIIIGIAPSPIFIQTVELITDERSDTAPIEKSNLPEFKLIDNAKVVSITDVVALKKAIQFPVESNNLTPLKPHNRAVITNASNGIATVPTILFPIFILFGSICFSFLFGPAIYPARPFLFQTSYLLSVSKS